MLVEGLGQRRGGRDRIPGGDGRAAIDAAERRRVVALDEDALADRVGAAHLEADLRKMLRRVVAPQAKGLVVRRDQLVLALELLRDQRFEHGGLDAKELPERANIDDVLEELALARVAVLRVGQLGQRHADDVDVVPELRGRQRPRRIVEQIAAGLDRGDVLVPGLRVHGDHEIDAAAPAEMAVAGHPHLVPGRQPLDVGREDVARRDGHAHADDRAGEQPVGARGARAVHVGELHHEIVGPFEAASAGGALACLAGAGPRLLGLGPSADRESGFPVALPAAARREGRAGLLGHTRAHAFRPEACTMSMRDLCMSQAPVGQRSAHRPQCRHTSSSFTMTRWVLSGLDT